MLNMALDVLLIAHILAGGIALFAGVGAIVTKKGRPRHNRFGKYYGLSMAFVTTSAVPLSIVTESWFLLAIAVFSGYLVFAGYRVIGRRRRRIEGIEPIDWVCHGSMGVAGMAMIGGGGWASLTGDPGVAPALVVFGAIGVMLAAGEFRTLSSDAGDPRIDRHITFMGGAFIATVTAAITVNLTLLPPLARWLGPTVVGVPLIFYAIRLYRPVFAPAYASTAD